MIITVLVIYLSQNLPYRWREWLFYSGMPMTSMKAGLTDQPSLIPSQPVRTSGLIYRRNFVEDPGKDRSFCTLSGVERAGNPAAFFLYAFTSGILGSDGNGVFEDISPVERAPAQERITIYRLPHWIECGPL